MKSIDVIGMMKTASSVVPLENDNKFLVRWGNNRETVIVVEEAAQHRVQPTGGMHRQKSGSKRKI